MWMVRADDEAVVSVSTASCDVLALALTSGREALALTSLGERLSSTELDVSEALEFTCWLASVAGRGGVARGTLDARRRTIGRGGLGQLMNPRPMWWKERV